MGVAQWCARQPSHSILQKLGPPLRKADFMAFLMHNIRQKLWALDTDHEEIGTRHDRELEAAILALASLWTPLSNGRT